MLNRPCCPHCGKDPEPVERRREYKIGARYGLRLEGPKGDTVARLIVSSDPDNSDPDVIGCLSRPEDAMDVFEELYRLARDYEERVAELKKAGVLP